MDRLFLYLTNLSSGLSYLIVFGILVACGLGFPLPEDIPLIASGYLVWEGTMTWPMAFVVTMVGVIAGDSILFAIGRRTGIRILAKPPPGKKPLFPPERVRRTRAYFRKYGDKIVFFARFVAGIRAVVFFMAGAMKMKYSRFILLDGLAALLSVPLWILLGYYLGHYFGDEIGQVLAYIKSAKHVVTGITLAVVLGVVVRLLLRYRRARLATVRTKK